MTRRQDRKVRPVCEPLEGRQVLSLSVPSLAGIVPVIQGGSHKVAAGVAAGATPNVNVTLQVKERDGLVDTHIDLAAGDRVVFYADGTIWSGVWFTGRNGPGGWNNIANDPKFPDPAAHAYSLLGVMDGDQSFEIGTGFDKVYTGSNGT